MLGSPEVSKRSAELRPDIVRDINSGATQVKSVGFEVPKFTAEKLATSTLVLAVKLQALNDQLPGMFTIGPYKVIPNVSGTYKRGQDVGIYMQVYNAGIDQTTLRPAVDVPETFGITLNGPMVNMPGSWSFKA